jgi:hypothetical protein
MPVSYPTMYEQGSDRSMETPTLGEGLLERTPVVEKTRREVEKLRVDEEG